MAEPIPFRPPGGGAGGGPPRYDFDRIRLDNPISKVVGERVKTKRVGREQVGLCPFHAERTPSFTCTDDRGFAHCFGCGWHGDVIDFVKAYHGLETGAAVEYLGGNLAMPTTAPTKRQAKDEPAELVSAPVPDSHDPFLPGARIKAWNPKTSSYVTYTPDGVWAYENAEGQLTHYIIRLDRPGGDKIIIPLRPVDKDGAVVWAASHPKAPRPLYGLPRLENMGQVFLLEGEKAADAAATMLPGCSLAWPGGTNGVAYVDFSPLAGRRVVVWGDADEAGEGAAKRVGVACLAAGAAEVKLVPWDQDKPKGWDVADAKQEGWTREQTIAWLKTCAYLFEPSPDEVEAAAIIAPEPPPAAIAAQASGDFDAAPFSGELPPPRPWAYSKILLYRTVTAIAAPPGTGKSTWALQMAIAFGQHMPFGPFEPVRTGPAWVWNNEDDGDELNRRTLAACMAMGVSPGALAGKLYLNSGADRALIVAASDDRGNTIARPDVARVIEIVRERGIKLLIVDPFSETFEAEENDNGAMKLVAGLYRTIAQAANCAVMIIVHTPKGKNADNAAGEMDAIRGGGAIAGVVRSAWTMFEMSEADAERVGIPEDSRHLYVRMDAAKANMGLKSRASEWWRKESVALDNAADGYEQDIVGVLEHHHFATPERRAVDTADVLIDRLSAEIVRVCERNGWTKPERAASLDTLVSALDVIKTGVRSTKSKGLIIGQMAPVHGYEEWAIIVSEMAAGPMIRRRIHIERRD